MTILPLQNPSPSLSGKPQSTPAAERPAVEKSSVVGAASAVTLRVSASYSSTTSVTLGNAQQRSLTYGAPTLGKTEALGADPAPKNGAADNILAFISQRLATDLAEGASTEELQSRLAAALEGFKQGFGEAKEQLVGSGFLSPEIDSLIQDTYAKVLAGVDALAEKYGLEAPELAGELPSASVPDPQVVAPQVEAGASLLRRSSSAVDSVENIFAKFAEESVNAVEDLKQLLKGTEVNYERVASRDFSFSLKTQDGDAIRISANAVRAEQGSAEASQVSASGFSSSQFSVQVEGELDEDELSAIADLLSQIGDLSSAFFSGDIEQAFELALDLGFDESEIAKFSLNLEQQVTTKVQATYATYDESKDLNPLNKNISDLVNFAGGNNSLNRLADFVEMLENIVFKTEQLGIDKSVVPEFAGFIADNTMNENSAGQSLQVMLEKLV